ncbi:hypothetical protein HMSSN139_23720 [Paenibacillus sp. HMSSN-139]|nr:hypothetical protein HMSSN139_23720 [Paenibacillus sp. HMSSN-139]
MEARELELFARQDREDLLAVLQMRFGEPDDEVKAKIASMGQLDELQRLILAACNAPAWNVFTEELWAGEGAFKLTGERFNPLSPAGFDQKGDF